MKLFSALRSGKRITYYVMCMAVLIGLAWASHVQALPLQIGSYASEATGQRMDMTDCLPCAFCDMATPSVAGITENSDHPALVSAATMTRFVAQTESYVVVPDVPVRPAVALRLLYCRWLN